MDKSAERYLKIAEERAEREDFSGALSFLFCAEKLSPTYEVFYRIADVYGALGMLEHSNKYWFKFLSSAPKDKRTVAFEELAINYFYLDNFWATSHYFHKKISIDGYISKENLDKDLMDFLSGDEFNKHAYRLVYPYSMADYEPEIKSAKRAIAIGAFSQAVKVLVKIPKQARTEEICGDLAVAYFMDEDFQNAEAVCRDSLERHGDNVTAYCNLSTIFDMQEDCENGEYYYKKALECRTGDSAEVYKLATCAIERGDHNMAESCIKGILKDRPNETSMRLFYGQVLLNLNQFDKAKEEFKKILLLDSKDAVAEYYYFLAKDLASGVQDGSKVLPVAYVREIPKKVTDNWSRKIRELAKTPEKISAVMKNANMKKIARWGLIYGGDEVMRSSAYVLSASNEKFFNKLSLELLLDNDVPERLKRLLVYVLILKGYKKKICAVMLAYYLEFTPKKLACEKDERGMLYISAYALCMSRIVFYDVDNLDNVAKATDKVYKKLSKILTDSDVTVEEVAGLILSQCSFRRYSKPEQVCDLFDITDYKLKQLTELVNAKK